MLFTYFPRESKDNTLINETGTKVGHIAQKSPLPAVAGYVELCEMACIIHTDRCHHARDLQMGLQHNYGNISPCYTVLISFLTMRSQVLILKGKIT
jgi:hypothetical protein